MIYLIVKFDTADTSEWITSPMERLNE